MTGPGSYARMKTAMLSHVENVRHEMFLDAIENVQNKLEEMCEDVEQDTIEAMQDLVGKMERDYLAVFVGEDAEAQAKIPWAERVLRDELGKHLEQADSWFAALFPVEQDEMKEDKMKADDSQEDEAQEDGPKEDESMSEVADDEPAMLNEPRSEACESDATIEEVIAQQLAGSQPVLSNPVNNGVKEEPL